MSRTQEKEDTRPTIRQRMGLWGYKLLCSVLKVTNIKLVATFGRAIGYLVWAAIPSRRRIVARNLRITVDPMLRADKLNSMVRRNIVRTCMNLACSLKTGLMTAKEEAKSINMVGADTFEQCGSNGHTAICCIPHAGNWEILARIRPHFHKVEHYGSMYRRMSNPLLEELVYRSRTAYGCEMFSKEDGLRAVLKLARTGGLLGVLSDQFTQEGLFLPYFGKTTGVTPLPALLYKRCKGKGHLLSVFTRNTGLGKWDAELGRLIELPEGCDSMEEITLHVNHALEKCQLENILDGFWMHHRWKCTSVFAPKDAFNRELIEKHARLPFRIIVCMPEDFNEALYLIPALRLLKNSRPDAQLTLLSTTEQQAYWQNFREVVSHVCTTDGKDGVIEQLEADELYKDGPYDILFMFSRSKKLYRKLQALMPIYTVGFAESGMKLRTRYTTVHTGPPRNRAEDYLANMRRFHKLSTDDIPELYAPLSNVPRDSGDYIAPFSSLGQADCWEEAKWQQLIREYSKPLRLLALPQDKARAEELAQRLEIPCVIAAPHELAEHVGAGCRLFATDGILPHLAAAAGAACTVIMASRAAERYGICLGEGHKHLTNHLPCHPCHRNNCDMTPACTEGISVEQLLSD
ncbi:MAG: hypothetical protein IJA63_11485 [Akkermansia sp.]|nr:hypothetical protein [Akkermansia sp.]